MANDELGSWTFTYVSEDGNYHSIAICAPNLLDAVDRFEDIFGDSTSFMVSV